MELERLSYQKLYMFEMWPNSMFEIILSMKIKYYDSINQNNFVMRTILILGFDLIENHNS